MPLIDMPLEQLKAYKGISPKPSDFDEFWDKSIALADSIDPNIEIVPAERKSRSAHFYHLYFTGTGNARVHAKLIVPKNKVGKCPALLHFHGYGGRSSDFCDYTGLAAEGYVIAALDCRGQGGESFELGSGTSGNMMIGEITYGVQSGKDDLLFRHIFLDTFILSKIVKAQPFVDSTRIGVYGGSQGGALSIACACLDPEIKMIAAQYPFLSDYRRVWEMDLAKAAYNGITEYFRRYDPRHEKEKEFFETLGYIDIHNLAPRMKGKLLMITGLADTICPPSTQFAVFNNVTSEKKMLIYPDYGHEGYPGINDIFFEFFAEAF